MGEEGEMGADAAPGGGGEEEGDVPAPAAADSPFAPAPATIKGEDEAGNSFPAPAAVAVAGVSGPLLCPVASVGETGAGRGIGIKRLDTLVGGDNAAACAFLAAEVSAAATEAAASAGDNAGKGSNPIFPLHPSPAASSFAQISSITFPTQGSNFL